jgi:hypothetical protein
MSEFSPGIQRVLEHIKGTPRVWRLRRSRWIGDDGRMELRADERCPLQWFTGEPEQYCSAAIRLGLTDQEADQIIYAADGMSACDPALRAALLEAAGL